MAVWLYFGQQVLDQTDVDKLLPHWQFMFLALTIMSQASVSVWIPCRSWQSADSVSQARGTGCDSLFLDTCLSMAHEMKWLYIF